MTDWWPSDHHIGDAPIQEIVIEPFEGGRWYTRHEDGSETSTGFVAAWDPPARVVVTWQIGADWRYDPRLVTTVEVRFVAEAADRTRSSSSTATSSASAPRPSACARPSRRRGRGARRSRPSPAPWRRGVKFVVLYASADDVLERAPEHFPAHSERIRDFHERGEILMVGTFGDPQSEGSMAVFPTRAAAEAFVADDPFVLNGVVRDVQIRDWNEVLLPD